MQHKEDEIELSKLTNGKLTITELITLNEKRQLYSSILSENL